MFCPNCGVEAGDGRFCRACGARLDGAGEAPGLSGWTVGMPCPYCGAGELEGDRCAYCGSRLLFQGGPQRGKADPTDILYRKYWTPCGCLVLAKDGLLISRIIALRSCKTMIPYDRINCVSLERTNKKGFLFVRGNSDEKKPPASEREYTLDRNTIYFPLKQVGTLYQQIFWFLAAKAPEGAQRILKTDAVTVPREGIPGRGVSLNPFFDRYQPFREPAAAAMREQLGIAPETAGYYTDALFDMRQEALYRADPEAAARDLARVVEDRILQFGASDMWVNTK